MNRYTIHLDVFAEDSADAWRQADHLGETTSAYSYALTTADDWSNHVAPPRVLIVEQAADEEGA